MLQKLLNISILAILIFEPSSFSQVLAKCIYIAIETLMEKRLMKTMSLNRADKWRPWFPVSSLSFYYNTVSALSANHKANGQTRFGKPANSYRYINIYSRILQRAHHTKRLKRHPFSLLPLFMCACVRVRVTNQDTD